MILTYLKQKFNRYFWDVTGGMSPLLSELRLLMVSISGGNDNGDMWVMVVVSEW